VALEILKGNWTMKLYSQSATARKFSSQPDFYGLADSTFPRSAKYVDPQLRWQIEQIAENGARALYELILELREASTARGWFDNRIATYASIRREQLRAIGADHFPDHLAAIDGGRRDV